LALAQPGGDAGERVAAGADRRGLAFATDGERRQHVTLAVRVGAGGADEAEDARVRALDAAHEGQRLQQLREAVGVQHDGDEVRPVAHIALAQQRAELGAHVREAVAQPPHALARLAEAHFGRRQPGVGGVQFALCTCEPAFEHGDLAGRRAFEPPESCGGARQRVFLRLAGADLVAQLALALPARGRRRHEGGEQEGDGERGDAAHGDRRPGGRRSLTLAAANSVSERCKRSCDVDLCAGAGHVVLLIWVSCCREACGGSWFGLEAGAGHGGLHSVGIQ
jgi:hypothetical protein